MDVRRVLPRDAIPSIDDPTFDTSHVGESGDDVIVVESEASARAYPTRILDYHEIVNDRLDDTPIAVTWCPLCGSAVVYERVVDGRELTFGVSGKLADDDLVMYDRETESEWKQSLGECIAGPLDGEELAVLPAAMTTCGRFREEHPDGVVLQPSDQPSEAASEGDDPAEIDYGVEPYREYLEADGFGLDAHRGGVGRTWERDDVGPKEVVVGIESRGEAVGVPTSTLEDAGGIVQLRVGDADAAVFAAADGVHAFRDPGWDFEPLGDDRFRADGAVWDGSTGRSDDGRRLDRLPTRRLFAFAWQDDHGPDAFYDP